MPDQLFLSPLFRILRMMYCQIVLFALLPSSAHAAFEFQPIGAHTAGTGDAGVALADGAAGAFWNPAALAWGERLSLFGAYHRPFGIAELATHAFSAGLRMGRHGLGGEIYGIWIRVVSRTRIWPRLWPARISTTEPGTRHTRLATEHIGHAHATLGGIRCGIKLQMREGVFLGRGNLECRWQTHIAFGTEWHRGNGYCCPARVVLGGRRTERSEFSHRCGHWNNISHPPPTGTPHRYRRPTRTIECGIWP